MANAKGEVIHGTGVMPGAHMNVSDRDYFIRHRDEPDPGLVISKALKGPHQRSMGDRPVATCQPGGRSFAGVVFTSIKLEHFLKLFSAMNLGLRGVVALRDGDLALAARYPEATTPSAEQYDS